MRASPTERRAYLVVYLVAPEARASLRDVGRDPDLDGTPVTWGICRTNVRRWVRRGSELFFVAYDKEATPAHQYQLAGYLKVAVLVAHAAVVDRFHDRRNIILDRLPGPATRSVDRRVRDYVATHAHELRWGDAKRALRDLPGGSDTL